ncbi:phosphate butyryltransferase [Clostridiales bacterium BAD-6]|uniref:Phosphate butyryltransferase n=2 Tax=Sinanaerobacter chloroacetimidivorans TaxID=2818044 RepID=A0A8J8B1U7_9FIRM|nr:phosphate butyryltransferase [Sinanaerobacter chloroacetimidivorans]
MMKNFEELIQFVQKNPQKKKVAVAAAHDEHTLEGIHRAYENGIAVPILIGDQAKIESIMKKEGFSFPEAEVVNIGDDAAAARRAVRMVREGEADFLMKGKLQTADLLKEVVNKERGLQKGGLMSHFGIFEVPGYHKLLVLTDGGMLPYPDTGEKAQILMNAVKVLNGLGYENPKVAVLAAAELVNPKMQESVDGDLLKTMNREGKLPGCIVEGPISYDLAMSPEAAEIKGYSSPVTGDTDILLMPNMTSGNLLAKAFQFTAGAKMAGMIAGAGAPIVLVSRGATAEEKYLSLVLSAASANKQKID